MCTEPNTLDDLNRRRAEAAQALAAIDKEISERKSQTLVRCACRLAFEVRELEYIQTQFYVAPHGCTGGDYWKNGEGQWRCPDCDHINRLYDKPDIEALKGLFKSVVVKAER
jgi:hypothetical protein